MGMNFVNLDDKTRKFMLEEFETDITGDKLYSGKYLTEDGKRKYVTFMREAIKSGDDMSLAKNLSTSGMMVAKYQKRKPKGGFTLADVPVTAPETLAEGEFNRFYCRGVCRRAIAEGLEEVEVYRAKPVYDPRPQSQALVGSKLRADRLLHDLQTNIGVDLALGVPAGPNSGISIRLLQK